MQQGCILRTILVYLMRSCFYYPILFILKAGLLALCFLVKDGLLTPKDAAVRINLTEDEFMEKLRA